jgi:Na+/phosphate symporter
VVFSSEGQEELNLIHTEVLKLIQLEITNFASDGKVKNKPRNKLVESINQLGQESIFNHRRRLSDRKSSSIGTSSMHQDAVRDMLQVVGYISNMDIS